MTNSVLLLLRFKEYSIMNREEIANWKIQDWSEKNALKKKQKNFFAVCLSSGNTTFVRQYFPNERNIKRKKTEFTW